MNVLTKPGQSPADSKPVDKRVLHPCHGSSYWPNTVPAGTTVQRVAVIDMETTGLDPRRDHAIELAAAICLVDERGLIAAIETTPATLIDPGEPLSPTITSITGITDSMVKGRGIDRPQATAILAGCDWLVAFNSAFDRPFLEALLPDLPAIPWACAMKDIPWRALGYEPGPRNYLLMQAGGITRDPTARWPTCSRLPTCFPSNIAPGFGHVGLNQRVGSWRIEREFDTFCCGA